MSADKLCAYLESIHDIGTRNGHDMERILKRVLDQVLESTSEKFITPEDEFEARYEMSKCQTNAQLRETYNNYYRKFKGNSSACVTLLTVANAFCRKNGWEL